jgi:hypothetical protein
MQHYSHSCTCNITRRQFLRYLLPSLSLAILSTPKPALAQTTAKALVLSCIDFEILEAERYFLSLQSLTNKYDFTALAGSSLALSGLPHQADAQAFWDQLDLSYRVHHVRKVIILDHQNCSAYADKIDPNLSQDPQKECEVHAEYLSRAYWAIRDRYPDLNIELYFVSLNSEVKPITPTERA